MLIVGLTGGIASGKTTVSQTFAAFGVPIVDTDVIARELTEPGQPAFHDILNYFGVNSINPDGTIDRAWLRQHIFEEETARHLLEVILHPPIYAEVCQRLDQLKQHRQTEYAVVVIPLLAEHPRYLELLDRVLVVDVPQSVQHARLMARDQITAAQADQMLASQANRDQRLAIADDILDNSSDSKDIEAQVAALDRHYRQLKR